MGSAVGSVVGGLFGSSNTPAAPNVSTFQPTGTTAFDQSYQTVQNSNLTNPYTALAPQATATFNQQYNNPYAAGFQTAANNAGAAYGATGAADSAASTALTGAGNTGLAAGNTALNMGFDPNSALYSRTLQQLNDSVNANSAQTGTTNSPYGASVANTADSNFNIDWQNNQLTKALAALSGYNGATSAAGADFSGANTLGTEGAANLNNAGNVPFAASNVITGSQNNALTSLLSILGNSGAGAFNQSNLSSLLSYLGLGAQQSNDQANLTLQNYQNQLAASQNAASGFGGIASGLTNILGNNSSSIASLLGSGGGAAAGAGGAADMASMADFVALM